MARDASNQYNIFKVSSPMAISEATTRLARSDSFHHVMIPSGHDSPPEEPRPHRAGYRLSWGGPSFNHASPTDKASFVASGEAQKHPLSIGWCRTSRKWLTTAGNFHIISQNPFFLFGPFSGLSTPSRRQIAGDEAIAYRTSISRYRVAAGRVRAGILGPHSRAGPNFSTRTRGPGLAF